MVFLAHFTGDPLSTLFEWELSDLCFWYNEAAKLHNVLNSNEEE